MASKSSSSHKADRVAKERAATYQARQEFHAAQQKRRRRDNTLAIVIGGVLILVAIGAQVAYVTVGPGQPAPTPTVSSTTTPTDSTSITPEDEATPMPEDSATPAE